MTQNFNDFNLDEKLLQALEKLSFREPTPIQREAIPLILEGEDILGLAQTGTGKTATFSLPILQQLLHSNKETKEQYPKALILAPTRELCAQIEKNLGDYAKFTNFTSYAAFGGVSPEPQIETLQKKVDILIATPGRLVDLVQQKNVFLDDVDTLVLDEADHIIEMGLRVDLKKILKSLPKERQTLLFSATMKQELKEISLEIFKSNPGSRDVNYKVVEITPEEVDLKLIQQQVLYVLKEHKIKAMLELLKQKEVKYVLIFTNTKQSADDIVRSLTKNNIKSFALHSGKSQTHREKVVRLLSIRELKVVVATDLAARGLDFEHMTHVINFEIPNSAEKYTHRVGRIGRAGKQGKAYSLCSLDERDSFEKIIVTSKYPITTYMHDLHSNQVKTNSKQKGKKSYFKPKVNIKKSSYNNRKKKK